VHHTATSPAVGWGREQEKQKREKLTGQEKDSSISEEKGRKKTSDARAVTHHFPQTDWCPAIFGAMTASLKILSPPFLLLSMTLLAWNILLVSVSQLSMLCPLPALTHLCPACWGDRVRKRQSLDNGQVLLINS